MPISRLSYVKTPDLGHPSKARGNPCGIIEANVLYILFVGFFENYHVFTSSVIPKMRKEGPCAGTKGYRAPEVIFKGIHTNREVLYSQMVQVLMLIHKFQVLLKSPFQNEKIDIWSAGVSLFQLILGKSPFSFSSNLDQ